MFKSNKLTFIGYSSFSILILIISIIIAAFLNLWTLVFPVILIAIVTLLAYCFRLKIQATLELKSLKHVNKKQILFFGMGTYVFQNILIIIPIVGALLINTFVLEVFNVYMLIVFFLVSWLVLHILMYYNAKHAKQNINIDHQ